MGSRGGLDPAWALQGVGGRVMAAVTRPTGSLPALRADEH